MDKLMEQLANSYVLAYVVIIIFVQWGYGWYQSRRKKISADAAKSLVCRKRYWLTRVKSLKS